ncbi:MAG: Serine/threonine-protein kinase PknD [Phycisphaerae bacterium]|nr:Serine/threonine-protein kinase PknD [Phycisphaerae bacterium]
MTDGSSGRVVKGRAERIIDVVRGVVAARLAGEVLSDEEILGSHPELAPELEQRLRALRCVERALADVGSSQAATMVLRVPQPAPPVTSDEPGAGRHDAGCAVARQPSARADAPPPTIAGYELLRELHRGGQGVVYLATQQSTGRHVALKVMREGPFAGPADRARFEREVHLLAQLDHPHIVAIFDSGIAAGAFYYAMKYVDGVPLDAFCRERRLSVRDTLTLFIKVCDAVTAAHLRGIIHRDLKPGNVLVDVAGEPHVLDFGLAKIDEPQDQAVMTQTGAFVGSVPWSSPEQAHGQSSHVDVRTDVYALGVMLYQALTGEFPYPVRGPLHDVLNNILNAEPPRPSRHFRAEQARHRALRAAAPGCTPEAHPSVAPTARPSHGNPPFLASWLRGFVAASIDDDVDTLVLKALAKEPARRYQTAADLARDLRHYLANEPIEAKRDSWPYVLRKGLRRHRAAAVVGGTFLLLAAAAAVVSTAFWLRAETHRAKAESAARDAKLAQQDAETGWEAEQRERNKADAINRLVTQALIASDPNKRGRRDFTVAAAMEEAMAQLEAGSLAQQPEIDAALSLTIAQILDGNARSEDALRLAERALETYQRIHDSDHPTIMASLTSLAHCLASLGRLDDALDKHRASLEMSQRLYPGDSRAVAANLHNVAFCLDRLSRCGEALPMYQSSLDMMQRLNPGDHADVALSMNNLANCLSSLGRVTDALAVNEAALAMRRRVLPPDHPEVARSLNSVGNCLGLLDRADESLQYHQAALEMYQRLYPGDHPATAGAIGNVANDLRAQGRLSDALSQFEAALAMWKRLFPDDHHEVAAALINMALCLEALDRSSEALPHAEAAARMSERLFPGDHRYKAMSLGIFGMCLDSLERRQEALPILESALEMKRRLFTPTSLDTVSTLYTLAFCLHRQGRSDDARQRFEEALSILRSNYPSHPRMQDVELGLAGVLRSSRHFAEAESVLRATSLNCPPDSTPHDILRGLMEEFILLYRAWHAANPNQGYDQRAAEWTAKLDAWRTSTQPATTPAASQL